MEVQAAPLSASIKVVMEEAETAWNVPGRIALLFVVGPFLVTLGILATRVHRDLFHFLTDEDSVLEWAQVLGFVTAGVFAALLARQLGQRKRPLAAIAFAAFAIGCALIVGEEIAWGQRVLGLETPEQLRDRNTQGEITLHNIEGVLGFVNLGLLAVGLGGAVLPWVLRRRADLLDTSWRLLTPPLFLSSAFFVLFLSKLLRLTVLGSTSTRISEAAELNLAIALATFAWLQWRREQLLGWGSWRRLSPRTQPMCGGRTSDHGGEGPSSSAAPE